MAEHELQETGSPSSGRRAFLKGAGLLSAAYAAQASLPLAAAGQEPAPAGAGQPFPGLIMRQHEPDNLEMPFPTVDRFITPNERFYVRSHFAVPNVDIKTWRLRVEGAVKNPLELSSDELRRMPPRTATVLLECSGNSRVFITPKPAGVLWELGAVGTAEWTGVPLAAVLDRAGLQDAAVEVILEGADAGELREFPNPYQTPARIPFARSLPLAKARQNDVLLAYRMNGQDLPAAHGFPLRVVVPGWYGMASVKWLTRIVVTDRPFQGYFQTMEYAYFERRHGHPSLVPVTELNVKALIARPALNEVVPARQKYRVHGAAWTGESEVARVEVSADGGKTWAAARLLEQSAPHAWRLWEYTWQTPAPGRHVLMARATDKRGRIQPERRDPDRRNAMISHTLPIPVEVR